MCTVAGSGYSTNQLASGIVRFVESRAFAAIKGQLWGFEQKGVQSLVGISAEQ